MPRVLALSLFVAALVAFDPAAPRAAACPMCGQANETADPGTDGGASAGNVRPRAYMYSILFMMGMPVVILGGFGLAFYRVVRAAQLDAEARETSLGAIDPPPTGP